MSLLRFVVQHYLLIRLLHFQPFPAVQIVFGILSFKCQVFILVKIFVIEKFFY